MKSDSVHVSRPLAARQLFFCALLPLGFAYVALVLCGRSTPFASAVDPWGDWLGVTLSGPALYLVAGIHALGEPLSRRACLAYAVAFFTALHWQWIGKLTGAHFSLTAHHFANLSQADTVMLTLGALLAGGLTLLCLREAHRAGHLIRWLACFAALIATITAVTLCLPGHRLHIHHYFWALCLIPFIRYPQPAFFLAQAFLIGVYVEGASRWGMGAIWNR